VDLAEQAMGWEGCFMHPHQNFSLAAPRCVAATSTNIHLMLVMIFLLLVVRTFTDGGIYGYSYAMVCMPSAEQYVSMRGALPRSPPWNLIMMIP